MDIGYFQWVTYCMPFVLVMIPLAWAGDQLAVQAPHHLPGFRPWKPLQREIERMGRWNGKQISALVIFVIMVMGWFFETEPV